MPRETHGTTLGSVGVTTTAHRRYVRAAEAEGLPTAEWIRRTLDAAADIVLGVQAVELARAEVVQAALRLVSSPGGPEAAYPVLRAAVEALEAAEGRARGMVVEAPHEARIEVHPENLPRGPMRRDPDDER